MVTPASMPDSREMEKLGGEVNLGPDNEPLSYHEINGRTKEADESYLKKPKSKPLPWIQPPMGMKARCVEASEGH